MEIIKEFLLLATIGYAVKLLPFSWRNRDLSSRKLLYGLGGIMAIIVVGALYKEFLHDQLFPKRFGVVEVGSIYRSGQIHPALVKNVLEEKHIDVVIDLQYWEDLPALVAEKSAIEQMGVGGYRFPLNGDGTGDIESYVGAIKRLHTAVEGGESVLIHCAAGTQRTGGVIAAYRTLVQGKPASDAIAEMATYDWDPIKDKVLLEYLNTHIAELATRLTEEGVIPAPPIPLPHF